jgi:nitrite reductase/ring-hydroxylating ferredoxin subunit
MSEWFDVGHADDFAEGEVAAARAGSQAVAVFRLGEEIFALKDLCTMAMPSSPMAMWRMVASSARCTRACSTFAAVHRAVHR